MNPLVTGLLLGNLLIGQVGGQQRQLQVGDSAPNLPIIPVEGQRTQLGSFRNRMILLDFFLTT